jgi:hypothetical protein
MDIYDSEPWEACRACCSCHHQCAASRCLHPVPQSAQDVVPINLVVEHVEAEGRLRLRLAIQLSLKGPDLIRCCQAHRQSPSPLRLRKRTGSQGPLLRRHYPASLLIRPCPTPARAVAYRDVEAATLAHDGSPPITRTTFPTCRAYYPGGPRWVHMSVASPSAWAFPEQQSGRHPQVPFRGLLRLHARDGPLDGSTAQGGLRHEASTRPVALPGRSSATRSIDNSLDGTFLHW